MGNKILFTLYIDNRHTAITDEALVNRLLTEFEQTLKITSKRASYYLGLEIARLKNGSIFINQEY